MNDSMAHPRGGLVSLELPSWKSAVSWVAASLIALLFLASGLWKITDVQSAAMRLAGTQAPESTLVDGRPYSLQHGRVLLFFFDPLCTHCLDAAKRMSQLRWNDTAIVAIPVEMPQYGPGFLQETGLHAVVSSEFEKLAPIFSYTTY